MVERTGADSREMTDTVPVYPGMVFRRAAAAFACAWASAWAAGPEVASAALASGGYAGSSQCRECHVREYDAWRLSDHYRAMNAADGGSVLGDFSDVRVTFHGIETRFFAEGGSHFVDTVGDAGRAAYPVRYTFGFRPLQQYLLDAGGGRLQAFDVAWDARPAEAGGQRWFHLHPDEAITPGHGFFWTGHALNWSSHCADCHSTGLVKTVDARSGRFDTRYAEANVACEACHGAAAAHVRLARSGAAASAPHAGFERGPGRRPVWRLREGHAIAVPEGGGDAREVDMCGGCHSLRVPLREDRAGRGYHDAFRIQLVDDTHYFADGQIREEVFVLGSFLQSRMHARGVTCGDCHEPHSGALVAEGNDVCGQCHRTSVFDAPAHHRHVPAQPGSACVDCHMPARTYMGVDGRRDHSFPIPRPGLSAELGVPNACIGCHAARSNDWALASLEAWGVEERDHRARLYRRLRRGDPGASGELAAFVADGAEPAMARAGLLAASGGMPPRAARPVLALGLADADPLVRRGAVAGSRGLPPRERWQLLAGHLRDGAAGVRFELALALTELLPLPGAEVRGLFAEYRQALGASADLAATHVSLAGLEDRRGRPAAARGAYRRALELDPASVGALVDYADFVRRRDGDEEAAGALLRRALAQAPANAVANAAFGLHLVRLGRHDEALAPLARAAAAPGTSPYFVHVFAVAQHSLGNAGEAAATLREGLERWPWNADLLATLAAYLGDARQPEASAVVARLVEVEPESPRTRALARRLLDQPRRR